MVGSAVKNALRWMMMAKGASQVISWLVTIVVIRILTPGDYGLFAMASMLVVLAEMLKELGLGSALVQARNLTPLMLRQVFTMVLLANGLLYAVITTTAPAVAAVFSEEALEILIPVLALQFPIMAFETIPEALLSRNMDFRTKALIATAGAITNSVVTLSCALLGLGIWSLILGCLIAAVVRVVCYGFKQSLFYLPTVNFAGVGHIATFGGFVTISRFLNVLLIQSSFFIVGRVLGKEMLGVFSVASQLATLPMQKVSGILNEVGLAAFSKIQDNREEVALQYNRAMTILAFVSFPLFWGMASVAESLTLVVLGEKWLAIVLPLQLIAFVTPLRMVFNTTTPALLGIGRADVFFWNLVILNLLMPIASLLGTPYGVDGVSLAWLLAYPPLFFIVQMRSFKCLGIRAADAFLSARTTVAISFIMMSLVLALDTWVLNGRMPEALELIALISVGVATYVLGSMALNKAIFRETVDLIFR